MKKLSLLAFSLLAAPAFAQSSYWIANRASSDIMRVSEWGSVLERVATPTTLRSCATAPDGKVWVVRFIQPTFDIYNPATATFTPVALPSGSAHSIAFDAAGHGWVTNGATAVHEYDAAGTFVQSYTTTVGAALGITVDQSGNKWIAHRMSPASVSRIDPLGTVTNFPIVGAPVALLPVGVIADFRGLLTPSHIWVCGDSSSTLCELDATGATLAVYPMAIPGNGITAPAFDLLGRIWLSSGANGTVLQVDQTSGVVLQTLTYPPNNISVTTDNFGRIRLTSRVTFSGVGPPCEVRRVNATTGALEIPTKLQLGAFISIGTQAQISTQFQYCLVVDQLGDLDGDGEANFSEVLNGTSPTDARSNSLFSLESFGVTQNGSTPTFEVKSALLWVVAFALSTIPPTPVPGFGGVLQIDPTTIVTTSVGVGNASLPIAIPADPSLAGFEFFAQGVTLGASGFDFQNLSGMLVW